MIKLKHALKNYATQTTKPSETAMKEKPKENGAEDNESMTAETTQSNSTDNKMKGGSPPIGDHSESAPDLGEDNDMLIPFGGRLDSRDWLSYVHISQCLKLLLHSQYPEAKHQPSSWSAYEVCSAETLQGHLSNDLPKENAIRKGHKLPQGAPQYPADQRPQPHHCSRRPSTLETALHRCTVKDSQLLGKSCSTRHYLGCNVRLCCNSPL